MKDTCLRKTIWVMMTAASTADGKLQPQSVGRVGVVKEAGEGVQGTFCEWLLLVIAIGVNDSNVRVANFTVSAFVVCGEELESDDMEECIDVSLMRLFNRLHEGEAPPLQEQRLSGIAIIAEFGDEL